MITPARLAPRGRAVVQIAKLLVVWKGKSGRSHPGRIRTPDDQFRMDETCAEREQTDLAGLNSDVIAGRALLLVEAQL